MVELTDNNFDVGFAADYRYSLGSLSCLRESETAQSYGFRLTFGDIMLLE